MLESWKLAYLMEKILLNPLFIAILSFHVNNILYLGFSYKIKKVQNQRNLMYRFYLFDTTR